jgi:hypothetical protein
MLPHLAAAVDGLDAGSAGARGLHGAGRRRVGRATCTAGGLRGARRAA